MSLNIALAACAALLVALLALGWSRRQRSGSADERLDTVAAWPPSGIRILSSQERLAFATLKNALPEYTILAQVPLARFLKVPKRQSYSEWLRRLGHQCADLVVCDPSTEVIAVVDIQPPAAQMSERSLKRHKRIERALQAAGIRLYIWTENALPSTGAARAMVLPKPAVVDAAAATPAAPAAAPDTEAPPAPNPFDDDARDSAHDERIEMREPPPSTWFDEFDTAPMPLDKDKRR
jgi:Protein of unknown function (DUF2726)